MADETMTNRERFTKLLSFGSGMDRTPVVEWASWWDKTLNRWYKEGLPNELKVGEEVNEYFGQDRLHQVWFAVRGENFPRPKTFGGAIITDENDYEELKKSCLYGDELLEKLERELAAYAEKSKGRDEVQWFTLDGFFWFPRTLFGIENHLYAFYDYPDLMKRINSDLCKYYKRALEIIFRYLKPHFMTFAEDMSYNHGPMLSKELYDEFMLPFYRELIPTIKAHGTKVFIDTDGFVEPLIPWFLEAGIEGVLPLERMAGVDVNRIRRNYPKFLMIGGYDKTVMHLGEEAMRVEFERLLPTIRTGGYLPSVDHQTPPDVSLENYRIYMKLLREYAALPKKQ